MTTNAFEHLTKDDFKQALLKLRPIADQHTELLKAHLLAPNYTTTVTQLAEHMGYDHYGAVNLHYGQFAERVCGALSLDPEIKLSILVKDYQLNSNPDEHCSLVLRPQMVAALRELDWF